MPNLNHKYQKHVLPELASLFEQTTSLDPRIQKKSRTRFLADIFKASPSSDIPGAVNLGGVGLIPEIIAAATNPSVPNREWYLLLLLKLSFGEPTQIDYSGFDFKQYGGTLSKAAYDAATQVESALPGLYSLLCDDAVSVRSHTAYLLGFYSRKAAASAKVLIQTLDNETNKTARTAMEMALAMLDGYTQSGLGWPYAEKALTEISPPKTADKDLLLAVGAVWRIHFYPEQATVFNSLVYKVLGSVLQRKTKPKIIKELPFGGGDLVDLAVTVQSGVQPDNEAHQQLQDALIPILARAGEDSKWGQEAAMKALFQVFGSCTMVRPPKKGWKNADAVPAPLKRLIDMCLRHPTLLFPDLLNALGENGVPSDPDKLRGFFESPSR